jgi:prepilin-type N-terminal cleavage/methylation domain-containing protein
MSQGKIHTNSGFTLVEIMIVVLIIVILSQAGNILSLFSSQERGELEGISVNVLNTFDEVKTDALLGKTENKEIVRKRMISMSLIWDTLQYTTSVNLAKDTEDLFGPWVLRTLNLNGNDWSLATCAADSTTGTDVPGIQSLDMTFKGEDIIFKKDGNTDIVEPHIIIIIWNNANKREIHIDRRTGLTYERTSSDPAIPPSCQ